MSLRVRNFGFNNHAANKENTMAVTSDNIPAQGKEHALSSGIRMPSVDAKVVMNHSSRSASILSWGGGEISLESTAGDACGYSQPLLIPEKSLVAVRQTRQ
jgi:hypothetical protein